MIGIDSNILIRHLVQDDAVQSPKATALIERHLSESNPGFLSVVTIAEIVWVLQRRYRLSRQDVAAVLERVLQIESLVVEHEPEVYRAMLALKAGHSSFGDALIGALNSKAGCLRTLTFDRKATRLPGFELL